MAKMSILPPMNLNALGWFAALAAFSVAWTLFDAPIDGVVSDLKKGVA